MNCKLLLI